jgi:PadR family transcriptional regulator, regulatory protein PadR
LNLPGYSQTTAENRRIPFNPESRLAAILKRRRPLGPDANVFGTANGEYQSELQTAWETLQLLAYGVEPRPSLPIGPDTALDVMSIYMHIISAMRRKPGSLVPLEVAICTAAAELRRRGIHEFHGYELAKQLADISDRRLLTAYGTLYRALARLQTMGLLESRREDPTVAAQENRPGRRLRESSASRRRTPVRGRRRGEAPA